MSNDQTTSINPQVPQPPQPPVDDRSLVEISQAREAEIQKRQSRFKKISTVVKVLLILLALSGIGWFIYVQINKTAPPAFTVETPPENKEIIVDPNENTDTTTWTLYRNPKVRVFIRHPNNDTIIETESPALKVDVIFDANNLHPVETAESSLSEGYIFRVTPLDIGIRPIDEITQVKMDSFKLKCPITAVFSTPRETKIDGLDARTFEILNCMGDYLVSYTQKFGIYFEIVQLYKGDFGYKQKYRAILEEILRAFKFYPENTGPVGDIVQFTDPKNKVAFKHPNLDETCCDIPVPPLDDTAVIVQLGDKSTYKDANTFDGIGLFIGGQGYRHTNFATVLEDQKKLLKEDYKVVKGFDAVTQDSVVQVGKFQGTMLKGYSWRGNDLVYFEVPQQQGGSRILVFSIKNITGEDFQNKVMAILSSFETF